MSFAELIHRSSTDIITWCHNYISSTDIITWCHNYINPVTNTLETTNYSLNGLSIIVLTMLIYYGWRLLISRKPKRTTLCDSDSSDSDEAPCDLADSIEPCTNDYPNCD